MMVTHTAIYEHARILLLPAASVVMRLGLGNSGRRRGRRSKRDALPLSRRKKGASPLLITRVLFLRSRGLRTILIGRPQSWEKVPQKLLTSARDWDGRKP